MNVRDLSGDAREQAEESLSDVLASWWEAMSGEETYAHEWTDAADAVLRIGYRR